MNVNESPEQNTINALLAKINDAKIIIETLCSAINVIASLKEDIEDAKDYLGN